tara:strand:- start:4121 stop:4330 length:210 start_codon:yes stop_codon:yes gene_type:complete
MENKISDAKRNQANKQEEFLRPIKIAEELGYEFDMYLFGGNVVFYKTNNNGFKVYSTIAEILEEYEKQN